MRTIRFYAGKGLIPAPRLRGRTGLYDAGHRARLELIGELTGLGFTLAAIERQLEQVPLETAPEELALQRALLTPGCPRSTRSSTAPAWTAAPGVACPTTRSPPWSSSAP